jgi:hypothetical protein
MLGMILRNGHQPDVNHAESYHGVNGHSGPSTMTIRRIKAHRQLQLPDVVGLGTIVFPLLMLSPSEEFGGAIHLCITSTLK